MFVRTRSTLAALATLTLANALTAALPATANAAAPADGPVTNAYFNRLGGNSADRLVDELVSNIDGVPGSPAEESIRGAVYRFNEPRVTDALIRAVQRGVQVEIRTDAEAEADPEYGRLDEALSHYPMSYIQRCLPDDGSTACLGSGAMHNKFFLFSKVESSSWVVSTTSANLNVGSGTNLYNSTYIDVGNKALYDRFNVY